MIARTWRGRATAEQAKAYVRHFTESVMPQLSGLVGHRGAWLLQRPIDGGAEFLAVTLWDSANSIRAFAGPDISKAHVEPQARAVLSSFDDFAEHYEIVAGK
jgi:heme-degrading monooxygenase HmoA